MVRKLSRLRQPVLSFVTLATVLWLAGCGSSEPGPMFTNTSKSPEEAIRRVLKAIEANDIV